MIVYYKQIPVGLPQGGSLRPRRVGQTSGQPPSENYVNVSFDLIDLSDDTPSPKSAGIPKLAKGNTRSPASIPDGRSEKVPLTRKISAPDHVITDTSRNTFDDDHSDYVVAPSRGIATKYVW